MTDAPNQDIAARIRERRIELHLKQADVASAAGAPRSTYVNWELGRFNISTADLTKVAKALNCPVSYLLGEDSPGDDLAADDLARSALGFLKGHSPTLSDKAARRLRELITEDMGDDGTTVGSKAT